MLFYVANLIFIFLYWLLIKSQNKNKAKKNKIFLYVVFVHLFIIEGFRSLDFGQDAWYQDLYRASAFLSWKDIPNFNKILFYKAEIGYVAFNKLLNCISKDVHLLYITVSAIYLSSVYHLLKRYSYIPILSVFIFFIVFWFQSFYVLRQYIALAFIMMSIPFIIQRDIFKFATLLFVAFFFHQSSIVFVPMYYLYNYHLRLSFKSAVIFILSTAAITIAINRIFSFAIEILNGYDSYMEKEVTTDGNFKMAIVYLFYFFTYAFLAAKNKNETKFENFFFKLLGCAFILQLAGNNFTLMQRLNVYFSFSMMIVIPYIVKMIKSNGLRIAFVLFTVVLYSYIMFLDFEKDRYSITPYSSMFF